MNIVGRYKDIDIAENAIQVAQKRLNNPKFEFCTNDLLDIDYDAADLTVLLGVVDWLDSDGVELMMSKIKSKYILISHTQASTWSPYIFYRKILDSQNSKDQYGARNYSAEQIRVILEKNSYTFEAITHPNLFNPGALIWASRLK